MGISSLPEAFFGTQTGTRAMEIKVSEGIPHTMGHGSWWTNVEVLHAQWG